MSFISEFKEFTIKGNMLDMAIGVILGAAFGKVIDSLVKDILMPPLGFMLGGVDFRHLYVNLGDAIYPNMEAAEKAGAPLLKYGVFISTIIDFAIVALSLFMVIKIMMRLRKVRGAE